MISQPAAIDASTLLNLFATGEIESILRSMPMQKFVCSEAASEVLYLRYEEADHAPALISTGAFFVVPSYAEQSTSAT